MLVLRNMNQDGLENFFGGIKSNCQVSKTPIPIHFRSGYITSILNNLTSSNSLKSNCEKDASTSLLNDFQTFILNHKKLVTSDDKDISDKNENFCGEYDFSETIVFEPEVSEEELNFVENEEMTFISSLICDRLLQGTRCKECTNNIQTFSKESAHHIIETSSIAISYPSETFISNLKKLMCAINYLLPEMCTKTPLKKSLVDDIKNIILDKMGCEEHNELLKVEFINLTAHYAITTFCKNINDLLSGKTKILSDKLKEVQIYKVAFAYRKKNKKLENLRINFWSCKIMRKFKFNNYFLNLIFIYVPKMI